MPARSVYLWLLLLAVVTLYLLSTIWPSPAPGFPPLLPAPGPAQCPVPGQLCQDHLNTKYSPLLGRWGGHYAALHQASELNSNAIRTPKCNYLMNKWCCNAIYEPSSEQYWDALLITPACHGPTRTTWSGHLQHVHYLCYITAWCTVRERMCAM